MAMLHVRDMPTILRKTNPGMETPASGSDSTLIPTPAATSTIAVIGSGAHAVAGSPDDPRMQEALLQVEAFLAIEDK